MKCFIRLTSGMASPAPGALGIQASLQKNGRKIEKWMEITGKRSHNDFAYRVLRYNQIHFVYFCMQEILVVL